MESKYKAGDKVRIKSLDWYNSNKNENGEIIQHSGNYLFFIEKMSECCGKEFEVSYVYPNEIYLLKDADWLWEDWMLEDDLNINTNKQQILKLVERVQAELAELRALCNSK